MAPRREAILRNRLLSWLCKVLILSKRNWKYMELFCNNQLWTKNSLCLLINIHIHYFPPICISTLWWVLVHCSGCIFISRTMGVTLSIFYDRCLKGIKNMSSSDYGHCFGLLRQTAGVMENHKDPLSNVKFQLFHPVISIEWKERGH